MVNTVTLTTAIWLGDGWWAAQAPHRGAGIRGQVLLLEKMSGNSNLVSTGPGLYCSHPNQKRFSWANPSPQARQSSLELHLGPQGLWKVSTSDLK